MGQKRQRDAGGGGGGANTKQRWRHDQGKSSGVALPYGKQGILVTVDSNDPKRATREAIAVLEEAWEELTQKAQQKESVDTEEAVAKNNDKQSTGKGDAEEDKPLAAQEPSAEANDGDAEHEGSAPADYSALISCEVKDLKDVKKRPFVVKHIMQRAAETKVLRFRHCARFLPCTHICKPEVEDISKTAAAAVASALDCSEGAASQTVAVLYEHRAAPKGLERTKVIDEVIAHVPRPPHTVKLKGAAKTISVQVVRNSCGIAIVDDYHELARYNVKEVCKDSEEGENQETAKKEDAKDE